MKIPIPSDWDGQSWDCFNIQWPSSPEYRNILLGFLSQMTRGPFWEISTGWIPDAQAVGWQVWDRNHPLVSCDGTIIQDGTSGAQNGTCSAFPEETEEFDMPCLDLSGLIKLENGVLYVKDSCCDWVALGVIQDQEAPISPEILDGQLPVGQQASACGRAYAVWDTVVQTAQAVWDHKTDAPWSIISAIKNASPTNLTTSGVWLAISQAILTDTLWGGDDVFDTVKLQKVLCSMAVHLDAVTEKLSDDEWEAIKRAFANYGDGIVDIFIQNFYSQVLVFAIGRDRISTVAQAGALNNAQICDCPAVEPAALFEGIGLSNPWRYVFDFRASQHGWILEDSNTRWTAGLGLWAENQVTEHKARIFADKLIDQVNNGSTITLVGIVWQMIGDETYQGTFSIGTNVLSLVPLSDLQAISGDAPANAGTYTLVKPVTDALGADEDHLKVYIECEHLTDVSQKVIGLLFAGTGPGPLSTPPA